MRDASNNQELFSFDLPPELFSIYADNGRLTETRALDLKSEILHNFQDLLSVGDRKSLITFELDENWIYTVRQRLQEQPRRSEQGLQDLR